jgi:NTP pyrophosphatase (non-canonical NTP hydrolase)
MEGSMNSLIEIWKDQRQFNLQVREAPMTVEEQEEHTKYFVLCIMSELDEVLRCINWKHHRRKPILHNPARIKEEITDVFKLWLSMAQTWNISPEQFEEEYWRKSAVVRQRFNEEYLNTLEKESVLVDIDEVLCDFSNGLLEWLQEHLTAHLGNAEVDELYQRVGDLMNTRKFINAESLKVTPELWRELKTAFRLSGRIRELPTMHGAHAMLARFKAEGLNVILLTSRPIDEFPHVLGDTIDWLNKNNFPYDYLWFNKNKAEQLTTTFGTFSNTWVWEFRRSIFVPTRTGRFFLLQTSEDLCSTTFHLWRKFDDQ